MFSVNDTYCINRIINKKNYLEEIHAYMSIYTGIHWNGSSWTGLGLRIIIDDLLSIIIN